MITHQILNGFVDVLVANDVYDGINSLMQTTGVGGFRPNTVKLRFFSSKKIITSFIFFRLCLVSIFLFRMKTKTLLRLANIMAKISNQ